MGLRQSRGEEKKAMVLVNEASQHLKEGRKMYQLLEQCRHLQDGVVEIWAREARMSFKEGTCP